tara:strand:- start:22625 stop:24211 length:1587 start_codon:yes stop_codon:yes gene_type:complete
MGADWGLYSALRGQDNWAQKRQDKMQNLMLLEKREQKAQKDLADQNQIEQGMQEYFDEISKLDALAEDQGRIQEEEKNARRNIYKGIAAVNGNLKAYMSTGGISALSEYKRTILGSEAVKNAALNKVNMSNFIKDKSEGKYVKNVNVEIPVMENGKPKLDKNGNPVTKTEEVTMEQEIKLFQDGVINKLSYNGAERKVKLDPLKFSKTTKNPNDPYNAAVVTTDDIYLYAIEQGASEEYATKVAEEYGVSKMKSGKPWYWGKEDKYADMEKAAKAAKYSASARGAGGVSGTIKLNQTGPKLQRAALRAKESGKEVREELGPKESKFFKDKYNLIYNAKTRSTNGFSKNITAIDPITRKSIVLDNALDLTLSDKYVVAPDGRKYIEANVSYRADQPIEGNPHKENLIGYNGLGDNASRNNWTFLNADETNLGYEALDLNGSTDLVNGTVYVDITRTMSSQFQKDQINQYVNITNKYENRGASVNELDNDQAVSESAEEIKQYIRENNKGFTEEEVNKSYALSVQNREED